MAEDKPTGDLAEQTTMIYRAALTRGLRKITWVAATQLMIFLLVLVVAFESPVGKHWYVGWPTTILMVVVVTSWASTRDSLRLPLSPVVPRAPDPQEEPAATRERVRRHLAARSNPINRRDLRDHAWWTLHLLFAASVPALGSWVTHVTGYLTYGVAAAWLYAFAMIGLGWLQSRLLVFTLRQLLFLVNTDNRDSPE